MTSPNQLVEVGDELLLGARTSEHDISQHSRRISSSFCMIGFNNPLSPTP